MKTVAFCEIDPFCRAVLKKHWPDTPVYEDIRNLTASGLRSEGIECDVICGGFPCQDVSLAGRRAGLGDTRSGLWREYARLVGEIRPRYVIVENTPGLLSLGMGDVLGDLAALGYDSEWNCIPACYFGADHIRDRVWIVAHPTSWQSIHERRSDKLSEEMGGNAAHPMRQGLPGRSNARKNEGNAGAEFARPRFAISLKASFPREYREHQPVLGRGVHGIPNRVDRVRALGNAVVPQVVEAIGRAIVEFES